MRETPRALSRTVGRIGLAAGVAAAGLLLGGCGGSSQSAGQGNQTTRSVDLGTVNGYDDFTYDVKSITLGANCPTTNLPSRNGRYVIVELSVTAHKATKSAQSPLLVGDWSGRTAAGKTVPADYSRTILCLPRDQQFPTTLDKNGQARGALVFDVSPKVTKLVDKLTFAKPTGKLVIDLKHAPHQDSVNS